MNAFANVVSTAAHRVIRGVILTRQGLESKARSTSMVQELVKLLPPDLFRTCLARVRACPHNSFAAPSAPLSFPPGIHTPRRHFVRSRRKIQAAGIHAINRVAQATLSHARIYVDHECQLFPCLLLVVLPLWLSDFAVC